MGVCVVCSKQAGKNSKQSFHRFPLKRRPHVANKWVEWVRKFKNPLWTPSKNSTICSDHFAASAFDKSTFRAELNVDSVPTIISPAVRGCKRKPPLPVIDTDGCLKKHCGNNRVLTPEYVAISDAPEPTASSALEVQASQKESALHQINTTSTLKTHSGNNGTSTHDSSTRDITELPATEVPSTLKMHCGNNGISTHDSSTSDITELPATEVLNTTEKNIPAESNDECNTTPRSSTSSLPEKCSTGRRRSLLLHDHHYEDTPRTCRRKVVQLRENLQKSRALNKAQDHKIKRLKKKVVSLKELFQILLLGQDLDTRSWK